MAQQFWDWLINSPMVLGAATVLFFSLKGMAWLIVPALVLRRRSVGRRRV